VAISAERNIKAQRGGELRCKGWRQEAILRMLENNLENAERPEELIVYAGSAKAARDWESYDRIVEALKTMEEEQTLVVQSGKPIGLFTTHRLSPIAVIANGNVVGRWRCDTAQARTLIAGSHYDTVIDAGPLKATVEHTKHVSVPPILGGAMLVAGVALLFVGARQKT